MDFDALNQQIIACRKCPRLVAWREEVAHTKRKAYQDWEYWGKPVPGFGDHQARVLVVGPHPARTGRTARAEISPATRRVIFFIQHCIAPVLRVDQIQQIATMA